MHGVKSISAPPKNENVYGRNRDQNTPDKVYNDMDDVESVSALNKIDNNMAAVANIRAPIKLIIFMG